MNAIIKHINHNDDDLLENSDGAAVGLSGPTLGCIGCRQDVRARWTAVAFYVMGVCCPECGDDLAEEAA